MNEFDILKKLLHYSNEELLEIGYTEEQILELRSINSREEVKELSEEPIAKLIDLGYDAKQIKAIVSLREIETEDISEASLRTIGSKVALNFSCTSYKTTGTLTSGTTNATIRATFAWDMSPSWNGTDIIAFSWGKSLASNESKSKCVYKGTSTTNYPDLKPVTVEISDKSPNAGCAFRIDLQASYKMSGTATVYLYDNQQALKDIEARSSYGHQTLVGRPSVSWKGLSISFSTTVMEMAYDSIIIK